MVQAVKWLRAILVAVFLIGPVSAQANTLSDALEAIAEQDWAEAAQLRARLPDQPSKDVIDWHLLRASQGTFADYQRFIARNADWPGLPLLQRRGERTIPRGADRAGLLAYFQEQPPQSGIGALRYASALEAVGNGAEADAELIRAWREFTLTREEHEAFVSRHGSLLTSHHEARLDNLLWNGRDTAAERMFDLVSPGWQALARARIALREQAPGVDALIEAVPAALRNDPGLAYERFLWRARKGRLASAIELLAARSTSADSLGRPEEWANRRRSLARDLMRDDRNAEAYRLASQHFLTEGRHYADLEWLSGFLALRKLNRPEDALRHFRRFRAAVWTPISLGRAGYWEGRALEALNRPDEAATAYAFGAEYQSSFYGQLAAERAGLPTDPTLVGNETYPSRENASFLSSSVFQAGLALHRAGERSLAERFFVHLSESLTLEQMGQLADLTLELDEPHIALKIAKFAASRGEVLPRAYHPAPDLVSTNLPVDRALALAIARRESEFDPAVVSPAGARGLMQLMPRTGQAMANKLSVPNYSTGRLLTDPPLNARLGAAYLEELFDEFGNNIVLIAIGYNAGPSRARSWRQRFGDPRSSRVDVIDWIEHVPFRETRNYIMRVTESLVVYEMILAGRPLPLDVTGKLKQR